MPSSHERLAAAGNVRGKIRRMEKVVRKFASHDEADAADAERDLRLTPEQRIQILLDLQAWKNPDAAAQRFARVYRITQLSRS